MKVVLFAINASWAHTCLSIRALRPNLEKHGFEVVLIEKNLKDRTGHILETLVKENADIYSFSAYIWNVREMLDLSAALKNILPSSKIVFGGPEVSFATERFLSFDWIDALVCGEGEDILPSLCSKIIHGESVDRVIYAPTSDTMHNNGTLYRNSEKGEILYYESSRGCPFHCAYCLSCNDNTLRSKSVEETIADLKAFENLEFDYKIIKFIDRTFNADIKRANAIWEALLSSEFTKSYQFEICASLLNEESFDILSRFPKGKIQLEIGLQSTNEKTLKAVGRTQSYKKIIYATRRIYDMGNIHVHLDLIAGLPFETYDSFGKSFDDAYGSCHMLQLGFLKLLYGTPIRENMEEYEYSCLVNPPYTVLKNKWISFQELQKLSHIAEVFGRYFESGRFAHTLWYITPFMTSPFKFWEGLTDYISEKENRPLQQISQPEAYRHFMNYVNNTLNADREEVKKYLSIDFYESEHKNPPSFMKV